MICTVMEEGQMAKIVYRSLQPKAASAAKGSKLAVKRVSAPDASKLTAYKVDGNSPRFGSELAFAFKRSVAKARRENSELGMKVSRVGAKA